MSVASATATEGAPGSGDPAAGELARRLGELLAPGAADPAEHVRDLQRLTGGASRETWAFDLVGPDGSVEPLILRRDPPGSERPGGMANEAAALAAAARAGVPEPRLVHHSDDPAVLGSPFMVVERLEGETIARRILRDAPFAGARGRLARQCGEILARIHAIPIAEVPGLPLVDPLAGCRDGLLALEEPHPVLDLGMRWLEHHRPPDPARTTVVHGDFRNGNLVVDEDGVRGVLDWEIVHLGDPAEDLGWMCVKAWRFGAPEPVGGFGPYEALLEGYRSAGGADIDLDTVRWWEALGTLRWGLGCISQARRHLDGSVRSVELAAIGRRACEQELDLLAIIRSWGAANDGGAPR
ncbi:MAG TPA: phosphotransferase family protein [Acidimicrobiales bacterium]|nr:phosphotransferase family protein [Acidimicrobiales bacterium]